MSLNFVRSGYIRSLNDSTSALRNPGQNGWWWSSRVGLLGTALWLVIISTDVNPSSGSDHYHGLPLRCLSTVLDI